MKRREIIKGILKIIIAVCFILIAGFFILNQVIQKKIRDQLTNLSPAMRVDFSSVHARLFSSSVLFDSLEIHFTPYSNSLQNSHTLYFSRASLKGIDFLKFLFSKRLAADKFLLEDGNIHLDQFLLEKKDSAQSEVFREMKKPFKSLFIHDVELKRTTAFLHAGKDHQLLAKGDIELKKIAIDMPGNKLLFSAIDLRLSGLNYLLGGYKIRIGQLALKSGKKTLSIDSLELIQQTVKANQAKISAIKMTGFDVTEFLNTGVFTAETIVIGESKIEINNSTKAGALSLPPDLKKIHADIFRLHHSSISYMDKGITCRLGANVELHGLTIYKSLEAGNVDFGSVLANMDGVQYSNNGYQVIKIKKINLDSRRELVRVDELSIIPKLGKYEFGRKLGHQGDRVDARVSEIEILNPDFKKLLQQKLIAEKILVGESKAYIFRDRRLPRLQKFVPMPVEYLKTIPFDIRVKSLSLAASAIEYEEYPIAGYGQTGILRIEKARMTISPFINHPVASDPAYMNMNVVGSIMGSGIARGTILMPMRKNKPYYIRGMIERLELTRLNSSSENLGKIRIKSGFLDFLSFDFAMTNERSTGKIVGAYHHLIIQQLKKHTEEKNVADFASFMLRHLIIPLTKDKLLPERKRTGRVNYTRDTTRFVSHYFLQSLLMGVKKSFTLGFLLPK